MKEIYVSYEVAKLLKEKGFDEPCYMSYWLRTKDNIELTRLEQSSNDCSDCICAPSLAMAMAWLRKNYNLYICPKLACFRGAKKYDKVYYEWEDRVLKLPSNNQVHPQFTEVHPYYETFEQAAEAALKYSLENLI